MCATAERQQVSVLDARVIEGKDQETHKAKAKARRHSGVPESRSLYHTIIIAPIQHSCQLSEHPEHS